MKRKKVAGLVGCKDFASIVSLVFVGVKDERKREFGIYMYI